MSTHPSQDAFTRIDERFITFMHNHGMDILRYSLGIVFVWFGLLKICGVSPVEDLVRMTMYWFPPDFVIPFLGAWEVLIGVGLIFGLALRLTLILFWLQMAGTFLVLIMHPEISFQHGNPLLLTTIGEFVIKNIVLMSAGLAIGGTLRNKKDGSLRLR